MGWTTGKIDEGWNGIGWVDERWMDEKVDGWMDGQMEKWMDVWIYV